MIKSQYTTIVDNVITGKAALLVHGLSGAIDLVSGSLYRWFVGDHSPDELPSQIRERLLARGYLWNGTCETEHNLFTQISSLLHNYRLQTTINSFWIIPTYKCNLRCTYCFQDHQLHAGKGIAQHDMQPDEAIRLIESFDAIGGSGPHATDGKGRYITLFGGEPLMNSTAETVRAIVSHGKRKGYRIGAVTNGVDLHEFKELLGPDAIRWIQITLDGIAALNDKRRLPLQKGTFDRIVNGITTALEQGCKVSLRTNVDRELMEHAETLEKWAEKKNWLKNPNFSWYMTPVENHASPPLRQAAVSNIELISSIRKAGISKIKPPYVGKFHRIFNTLVTHGITSEIETSACGSHTNMYFFDPNGLIFACAEQVGKPASAVGSFSLEKNDMSVSENLKWQQRHVGNMPVCSRCANAFFCGGGCANAALLENNDFFGPRCNGIKDAMQFAGREYGEKMLMKYNITENDDSEFKLFSINDDNILLTASSPEDYVTRVICQ